MTPGVTVKVENAAALDSAPPQLLDELDAAFDRLGVLLERLQEGASAEAEAPEARFDAAGGAA